MAKTRSASNDQAAINPDVDRYPSFEETLRRILQEADLPKGPIDRLELTTLPSGEAAYRVWAAREEDPVGGYLPST